MKKHLVGIAVFLATFLFGTSTTMLAERIDAAVTLDPPVVEMSEFASDIPSGWYSLGKFTGMDEVMMITINNPGTGEEEETYGGVFTTFEEHGDQGFVESRWVTIDGNNVRFMTEEINGVQYLFDGTFHPAKWSGREGEKPISGTLQKVVNRTFVAEASGDFERFEPQCWH